MKIWSVMLIPDVGESRYRNSQPHGIAAQAAGIAEAALMFSKDGRIESIEIVVLEARQMCASLSKVITRESL